MSHQKDEQSGKEVQFHESCLAVDEQYDKLLTYAAKLHLTTLDDQVAYLADEAWAEIGPNLRFEIVERTGRVKRPDPVNAHDYIKDVGGLRLICVAMGAIRQDRPPHFPSLWRDTGTRQRMIARQLLALVEAMEKSRS